MKKIWKRALALALAAAMTLTLLCACGNNDTPSGEQTNTGDNTQAGELSITPKILGTDEIKIAYIPISTAGVTNRMVELAFNDTIDAYKDTVTVDYFDPSYDTQTQITMVNDAVNQGYDCILLECSDPVSLATPVAEAEAAGVPVITLNLNAETPHTLHLRAVDYMSGWKAAETLANDFGADSGQKVIIMDCPAAMAATNLQSNGFLDYMEEYTNWELLDHRNVDNFSQEGANTAMRDLLTKYDNIDIVFNMQDDLTAGVMQAIEAAGRNDGSITVYGNMGNPSTFEAMTNGSGSLYGLNFADYYTQYCMAMGFALYYAATGVTGVMLGFDSTPEYALSCWPVTPDNAELYQILSRWDLALAE